MTDSVVVTAGTDFLDSIKQVNLGCDLTLAGPPGELRHNGLFSRNWREPVAKARFYDGLKRFLDIVGGLVGLVMEYCVI